MAALVRLPRSPIKVLWPHSECNRMDLKEESLVDEPICEHWYYRAKLAALLKVIDNLPTCTVLDVGAGSGFFSRALLKSGRARQAMCVDPGYLADSDELVAGRPLSFRRALT